MVFTKILILAANPSNTTQLRLPEEVREIQEGLALSEGREEFKVISQWAVRPNDLRRSLLKHRPQIVHFSGHGTGQQGLVFENESGQSAMVQSSTLAKLFKLCPGVKCVLLNACYSNAQSDAIAQHVDHVIGMNQAIGDRAAIKFAVGFYDALGYGRPIPEAFEFGLLAIDLENIPESATPVLHSRAVDEKSIIMQAMPSSTEPDMAPSVVEDSRDIEVVGAIKKAPEKAGARPISQEGQDNIGNSLDFEGPEGLEPLDSPFYIDRSDSEKSDGQSSGGFWNTLPGVLTGAAGVIGATTLLILSLKEVGLIGHLSETMPTPPVDSSPIEITPSPTSDLAPSTPTPSIAPTLPAPTQSQSSWEFMGPISETESISVNVNSINKSGEFIKFDYRVGDELVSAEADCGNNRWYADGYDWFTPKSKATQDMLNFVCNF